MIQNTATDEGGWSVDKPGWWTRGGGNKKNAWLAQSTIHQVTADLAWLQRPVRDHSLWERNATRGLWARENRREQRRKFIAEVREKGDRRWRCGALGFTFFALKYIKPPPNIKPPPLGPLVWCPDIKPGGLYIGAGGLPLPCRWFGQTQHREPIWGLWKVGINKGVDEQQGLFFMQILRGLVNDKGYKYLFAGERPIYKCECMWL